MKHSNKLKLAQAKGILGGHVIILNIVGDSPDIPISVELLVKSLEEAIQLIEEAEKGEES